MVYAYGGQDVWTFHLGNKTGQAVTVKGQNCHELTNYFLITAL